VSTNPSAGHKPIIEQLSRLKILQIGNYPPPFCGWAVPTKLLVEEIRMRGHICEVLNINENRRKKSTEYICVRNAFDYLQKIIRFAIKRYCFQVHVNGQSKPGYVLALVAAMVGRLAGKPIALTWHGGLQQRFFPRMDKRVPRWAFQLLFRLAGNVSCNSTAIKQAIVAYGISPSRVTAVPLFSSQLLKFTKVELGEPSERFLESHWPIVFCYVSFRPEYKLPVLRDAMRRFLESSPRAGFIWLGFPAKELPAAQTYTNSWPMRERASLLLLGNLPHDEFLTLLKRSSVFVRTPACDGVSASVLESLALGIPVLASQNCHRPENVTTYREGDSVDLCARLVAITGRPAQPGHESQLEEAEDNIAKMADWLLAHGCGPRQRPEKSLVHAQ
jgi:glycosyltransferase involved in cell wall biosynthesis